MILFRQVPTAVIQMWEESMMGVRARRYVAVVFTAAAMVSSFVHAAGPQAADNLKICFGEKHAAMLKPDGMVWTWGQNDMGQLGTGTNAPSTAPVKVVNLANVTAIACGASFTLALRSDGTVMGWGQNLMGQLGNRTKVNTPYPVQTLDIADVEQIAAGKTHAVALLKNGMVMGWGSNIYGQVGDGAQKPTLSPVRLFGDLKGIQMISARGEHSLALAADGTVWSWGLNKSGQLGIGVKSDIALPSQVIGLFNVYAAKAGGQHSVAVKEDGTVWAWGMDNNGQTGIGVGGAWGTGIVLPAPVFYLKDVTAIFVCGNSTFAQRKDWTVWAWGNNSAGQLCLGSKTDVPWPLQVNAATGVQSIICSDAQTIFMKNDGTMFGCGDNSAGLLGDKIKGQSSIPVKLTLE